MQTNHVEKGQLYGKHIRMWLWKEYCPWSSKLGSRTKCSSWAGELPETPLVSTAKNMSCITWKYKAWAFYGALGTEKDCVFHQGYWWKNVNIDCVMVDFVSTRQTWGAQILSQTLFWVFLWGHFWMSLTLKLLHWVRQIDLHNVGGSWPISWRLV